MSIAMIVILNVGLVQTADDLRPKITNTAINVRIYLIDSFVKLADEHFPELNSQNIVRNVDQSVWSVDEKCLLFIMVAALNLVR